MTLTSEQIDAIRLLQGANASASSRIAQCPIRELDEGDILIEPGPHDGKMYIILTGDLRVLLQTLEGAFRALNAAEDSGPVVTLGRKGAE